MEKNLNLCENGVFFRSSMLYVGDAFGWDSEALAKVAIVQLRAKGAISNSGCPKAQLLKNESMRWMPNVVKIAGYFPLINIAAGLMAIAYSKDSLDGYAPNHTACWKWRGVAMILTGPLLLIVDLIKYIYNLRIARQYMRDYPQSMLGFATNHNHTIAYWPGHPIRCLV